MSPFGRLVVGLSLVLAVGCAQKITPQQSLVHEAFRVCQAQGPSTTLERVERDGLFTVKGPEGESRRVHDCMVRYGQPPKRAPVAGAPPGSSGPPPTSAPPAAGSPPAATAPPPPRPPATASAPTTTRPEPLVAGRLPGTWRGTLKLPPSGAGGAEVASPATVRFDVAAGTLRWTLAAGPSSPTLAADGTAIVVDGELRMTGTVRAGARPASPAPSRSTVRVRYAGTMVGDQLEVTGVTTDKQVHVLSIRRVVE